MRPIPLDALQTDSPNTVESSPNPILVSAVVIFFSYSAPHISPVPVSQIDMSAVISGVEGARRYGGLANRSGPNRCNSSPIMCVNGRVMEGAHNRQGSFHINDTERDVC